MKGDFRGEAVVNSAIVHNSGIQAAAIAQITIKGVNIPLPAAGIVIDDDGIQGDSADHTLIRLLWATPLETLGVNLRACEARQSKKQTGGRRWWGRWGYENFM
jgi:hypothetical protein